MNLVTWQAYPLLIIALAKDSVRHTAASAAYSLLHNTEVMLLHLAAKRHDTALFAISQSGWLSVSRIFYSSLSKLSFFSRSSETQTHQEVIEKKYEVYILKKLDYIPTITSNIINTIHYLEPVRRIKLAVVAITSILSTKQVCRYRQK